MRVYAAEPLDLGLPQVRTLVVVEKTSSMKKSGAPPSTTRCLYLSSHHPRKAEFFARLVRGHWAGCEIRNHWVRDAIFEEDRTRSRNLNLNAKLALLRGSLIALKARLCPDPSWRQHSANSAPQIPPQPTASSAKTASNEKALGVEFPPSRPRRASCLSNRLRPVSRPIRSSS